MSEITPEERAEHIAAEYEAYSPHVKPETAARELRLLIATAVHNAVAEEREACALIADRWAEFQRGESGSYDCPALEERIQGRLDASQKIAVIIRARRHTHRPSERGSCRAASGIRHE
jgi:hypothetical protein